MLEYLLYDAHINRQQWMITKVYQVKSINKMTILNHFKFYAVILVPLIWMIILIKKYNFNKDVESTHTGLRLWGERICEARRNHQRSSLVSFFFLWFFFLCSLRPASINQCNCDCNGASSGFSFFLLSLDFHWPQNEDPCRISFSFQFYLQKSKWQWMWSGTLSVGGCKTSTTSAPMTLRSPLSSVVTSTHQGRGEKERKPATCDIWYL